MAEEIDKKEVEVEGDEIEEVEEVAEDDTTDWKAIAQRNAGIAKRNATRIAKLKKAAEAKIEVPVDKKVENKKTGFDYAEKAYLKSEGVSKDDYDFVWEVMQSTGKSLDDVLDTKYFKAELKERQETRASKEAIPSGSKRSAAGVKDDVEYWIAKGTLPPEDQVDLRRKVVNEKIRREKSSSHFRK